MSNSISISPSRHIITAKQIHTHFSQKSNLSWIPMKQLLADTAEQCVDGRSRTGIIGTPGGNMGEFILALDAAEKITDSWIRPGEVKTIFQKYLKHFGAFYMHTDTHGLEHLLHAISSDKSFKPYKLKTVTDLEAFIRKPDPKAQPKLLNLLTDPQNIGCGHLKLMLSFKDEYRVRLKLIHAAIASFYQALWRGADLDFVVLDADHQEGAIVTVLVNDSKITDITLIPTVASMGEKVQMFISHPQAEAYMRRHIAAEIVADKLIYGITKRNADKYLETIVARGQDFTRFTLSHLALGLPHYTVTLKAD